MCRRLAEQGFYSPAGNRRRAGNFAAAPQVVPPIAGIGMSAELKETSMWHANGKFLLVGAVALYAGSIPGAAVGFSAGLLLDLAVGGDLGSSSLVLTSIGYAIGRYREVRDPALPRCERLGDGADVVVGDVDHAALERLVALVVDRLDDDLRPGAIHCGGNGLAVGDVQIGVGERRHLVRRTAFMDDRGPELAPGAEHDNPHQAAL